MFYDQDLVKVWLLCRGMEKVWVLFLTNCKERNRRSFENEDLLDQGLNLGFFAT